MTLFRLESNKNCVRSTTAENTRTEPRDERSEHVKVGSCPRGHPNGTLEEDRISEGVTVDVFKWTTLGECVSNQAVTASVRSFVWPRLCCHYQAKSVLFIMVLLFYH